MKLSTSQNERAYEPVVGDGSLGRYFNGNRGQISSNHPDIGIDSRVYPQLPINSAMRKLVKIALNLFSIFYSIEQAFKKPIRT